MWDQFDWGIPFLTAISSSNSEVEIMLPTLHSALTTELMDDTIEYRWRVYGCGRDIGL